MFDNFFNSGSIVAVILMTYSGNVMMEALRLDRVDPYGMATPGILRHSVSSIFIFCSIPCAIWPAIYIGLYDGWLAGIISWVVLQIIGALITIWAKIRGPYIGFHFIAACLAYPTGYILSTYDLFN